MQVHHHKDEFAALNTQVLVVGFEPPERAQDWLKTNQISFPLLIDLERWVYRAYRVERSLYGSWHPRNLWFYVRRFFRGQRIPRIRADPLQLGGDFIIDEQGALTLAYYSRDATDRPQVDQLLSLLKDPEI